MHDIQKCECCQTSRFDAESCPGRNIVVLDKMKTHVRNIRDGTMIKLDVNKCAQLYGSASMKQVQFSADRGSKWANRSRQACKAGSIVER